MWWVTLVSIQKLTDLWIPAGQGYTVTLSLYFSPSVFAAYMVGQIVFLSHKLYYPFVLDSSENFTTQLLCIDSFFLNNRLLFLTQS